MIVPTRYLIVNADDFGQSPGVNRGIMAAHERGIVTSTSLMVRWPAAVEAAAYSRERTGLSLGLHLDFGEWACRDYVWVQLYDVVPFDDADAVADEVQRQVSEFRRLAGRDPTHIDSHQHAHRQEPLRSIVLELGRELEISVRDCSQEVRYSGEFYGQTSNGYPLPEFISLSALLGILEALPAGITELGCHPGEAGDDLGTMYCRERPVELEVLCHPRVRAAVGEMGIKLWSFNNVRSEFRSS